MPKNSQAIVMSPEHVAAVGRRRRIYVNNDVGYGGPMGPDLSAITPEQWIAARFSAFTQPGSQVDCVGWCPDEGNIAAYPSKVLPELQYPTLLKWREEGVDIVDKIIAESRDRNLECFWEYRINGADRESDVDTPARHPVKDQHPEWLIEDSWWGKDPWAGGSGMWNYAVPEVRDYKVSIIRELAENYDLDGINLDFGRHPPFLPIGEQWMHRGAMTDFLYRVRTVLQTVAEQRGRPFLLSVRVADTVPCCHFDGLDVETWVRLNLVDMIIIGTRSVEVDLTGFREIVRGSHVRLYPCVDQHHSPNGYHQMTRIEFLRGLSANWWRQGADGIATFNFWNELPEEATSLASESHTPIGTSGPMWEGESVHARAYREMGEPVGLKLLDKMFVVARRGGEVVLEFISGAWNDAINMNRQAPLPLNLMQEPVWVEVYVADDVAGSAQHVERLQLRLLISGNPNAEGLRVKFNGVELHDPQIDTAEPPLREARIDGHGQWWTFELSPSHIAPGRNLLTVLRTPSDKADYTTLLEKVEVHLTYRPGSCQHSCKV